jgi:hypothetical protein
MVTHGRYARLFWTGAVAVALIAALVGAFSWYGEPLIVAIAAGMLVQLALVAYESVFVRAGQDVPLS